MRAAGKILTFGLFIGLGFGVNAQQLPFYSQYFFNPFIYNSAYTGQSGETRAFLSHRNQWTAIQGAPVTSIITIDGPINGEKSGLGLSIFSDRTDILVRSGARLAYSYKVDINEEHKVRFGLGAGIFNNKIDYDRAIVEDNTDPQLFSNAQSRAALDMDFGIGYFWKGLNVGFSMPQLLDNDIRYSKIDNDEKVVYGLKRHYVASAGYEYEIDDDWTVYPQMLTRITPSSPFQFDFGAFGSYQKLGWLGVMYKHQYAVGLLGGARINERLLVGASFDLIINDISGYSGTSSELLVGYIFGSSAKQKEEEARQRAALRQELDSLKGKLKETSDKTDQNTKDIDSLSNELQKVRTDLDNATQGLKTAPPQTSVVVPVPNQTKTDDSDLYSDDYLDNKGEPLPKGFYIVVGSYSEQKWARQAKLKFVNAGFPETDVLYNITNKFYNVFLSYTKDEEEARNALKTARAEYPDAWLRRIQ